jgi:hypothetical protein
LLGKTQLPWPSSTLASSTSPTRKSGSSISDLLYPDVDMRRVLNAESVARSHSLFPVAFSSTHAVTFSASIARCAVRIEMSRLRPDTPSATPEIMLPIQSDNCCSNSYSGFIQPQATHRGSSAYQAQAPKAPCGMSRKSRIDPECPVDAGTPPCRRWRGCAVTSWARMPSARVAFCAWVSQLTSSQPDFEMVLRYLELPSRLIPSRCDWGNQFAPMHYIGVLRRR